MWSCLTAGVDTLMHWRQSLELSGSLNLHPLEAGSTSFFSPECYTIFAISSRSCRWYFHVISKVINSDSFLPVTIHLTWESSTGVTEPMSHISFLPTLINKLSDIDARDSIPWHSNSVRLLLLLASGFISCLCGCQLFLPYRQGEIGCTKWRSTCCCFLFLFVFLFPLSSPVSSLLLLLGDDLRWPLKVSGHGDGVSATRRKTFKSVAVAWTDKRTDGRVYTLINSLISSSSSAKPSSWLLVWLGPQRWNWEWIRVGYQRCCVCY